MEYLRIFIRNISDIKYFSYLCDGVNPTLLLGKGNCKFAIGAYCDMMKETSFGLTLGLASRL